MLKFLKDLFDKEDLENGFDFDIKNSDGKFILKINKLIVGTLTWDNNEWEFQYSDDFRNQNSYHRLVGFSDLKKVYKSEILWPFFKIRIPGLKQPHVLEIIDKENINSSNEVELLKRFGRINISNPYILDSI